MDMPNIQTVRWLDMLRYCNRINMMKPHRLPIIVYEWDLKHGGHGWVNDVRNICNRLHLPSPMDNVLYDLKTVQSAICHYSREGWWEEAYNKPKLHTYVQVRNQADPPTLATSYIKRYHRSLLSKLLMGILPLEIEVGRYLNVKPEHQYCKVCNLGLVETYLLVPRFS